MNVQKLRARLKAQILVPLVLALGLAGAVACSKAKSGEVVTTSAVSPRSSSSLVSPASSGAALLPPSSMQSISERFASEARERPTGTVRAEDVFTAFRSAGAQLREQRQHLGSPFLASYCVGAKTGADVHMSVCEYKDAAKAREGKTMSEEAFAALEHRTVYVNGATTLTLRVGGGAPRDRDRDLDLAKKLADAFGGLAVKR